MVLFCAAVEFAEIWATTGPWATQTWKAVAFVRPPELVTVSFPRRAVAPLALE